MGAVPQLKAAEPLQLTDEDVKRLQAAPTIGSTGATDYENLADQLFSNISKLIDMREEKLLEKAMDHGHPRTHELVLRSHDLLMGLLDRTKALSERLDTLQREHEALRNRFTRELERRLTEPPASMVCAPVAQPAQHIERSIPPIATV